MGRRGGSRGQRGLTGELDDQRNVEYVLEVLGEAEWDDVSQMQCITGGPSPGIQVERLPLLMPRQDLIQLSAIQSASVPYPFTPPSPVELTDD